MKRILFVGLAALIVAVGGVVLLESGNVSEARVDEAPAGWTAAAPRDEIRPSFAYDSAGGRDGAGGAGRLLGENIPRRGGKDYCFLARRRVTNVGEPRRSVLVKLKWRNDLGERVRFDRSVVADYLRGGSAWATTEFPTDRETSPSGWTEVSGAYQAPGGASQAVVELHLQWAPLGKVEWSNVSLTQSPPRPSRKVRLATVHFQPRAGKTPDGNRRLFAPLIEEAARKKADLVVLPETLTYYKTGLTPADVAEPIPGPSTEYFGRLAVKHNLYIVAGLYERADHLVYNVAVLIDPDGEVAGKYRKVTLPASEVDRGVAPGSE